MSLRSSGASVASAIVLTLGLGLAPMPALAATSAELQSELDQAEAQLHSLYSSAEQANNDLVSVTNDLNETNAQIDQLETDIADQQVQLADTQKQQMAAHYDAFMASRFSTWAHDDAVGAFEAAQGEREPRLRAAAERCGNDTGVAVGAEYAANEGENGATGKQKVKDFEKSDCDTICS